MSFLVTIENLNAYISPAHQLKIDQWQIARGQHWGILGGNSSGKTSLAKLLTGALPPSSGGLDLRNTKIAYVSFDVQQEILEREKRRDLSHLMENAFDVGTTAESFIFEDAPIDDVAQALLERLRLEHILQRGLRYLSTGEIRKVFLARALMAEPDLIILDNPIEGLDKSAQAEFATLLNDLMTPQRSFLLLLSREADLLDGLTHLGVMQNLSLVSAGPRQEHDLQAAINKAAFADLVLPDALPCTLPGTVEKQCEITTTDLVRCENICVSYQEQPVLKNISWRFAKGGARLD